MSLLGVGVGARFEAVLPDGSRVEVHGSPTGTLRVHVANELFAGSATAVVRAIDRICIAYVDEDTGSVIERCTTGLTWSVVSDEPRRHESRVSGSITLDTSMSVNYFRAYAGADRYFESFVSPPFDVVVGQTLNLTMTLVLSTSHTTSVSGGLPTVSETNSRNLLVLLYLILRGQRPSGAFLTLDNVLWRTGAGVVLLGKPLSRTYTTGNTFGRAEHAFDNFGVAGRLARVHVNCTGQADCIVYTLSSSLDVNTSDRARYSISISVG